MQVPADLGPQIDPNTINVGDIVYLNYFGKYTKVRITRRRDAPDPPPYFWFDAKPVDKPARTHIVGVDPLYPWAPPYPEYKPNEFFAVRDSAQIQAQTDVLRNLGRYGKVPMNIAMHKLPGYLGLGGRSKKMDSARFLTKRRKSRRVRKSRRNR